MSEKPKTKIVKLHLRAELMAEYEELAEVPADMDQHELDQLLWKRYDQIDGEGFTLDDEYWERGAFEASEVPEEELSLYDDVRRIAVDRELNVKVLKEPEASEEPIQAIGNSPLNPSASHKPPVPTNAVLAWNARWNRYEVVLGAHVIADPLLYSHWGELPPRPESAQASDQ